MFCSTCGQSNPAEARYCMRCGQGLVQEPEAEPAPTATTTPLTGRPASTPVARPDAQPDPIGRRLRGAALGCVSIVLLLCTLLIVIVEVPDTSALLLSAVAAIVPAVLYSLIVVALDHLEREPWRILLGAFGWGAVVAVLFSYILNTLTGAVLFSDLEEPIAGALSAIFVAPPVEESLKGIALLGMLVFFRREFDNVVDGLVYGALIGLGFAMTENIVYFGRAYLEGGAETLGMLFVARVALGGFGHALYTATTGAAVGWARSQYGRGWLRFFVPVIGWSLAVLQHFLWNTGAIFLGAVAAEGVSWLMLVLVETLVLVVPGVLALLWIWWLTSRHESEIISAQLAEEVERGALTAEEYAMLSDGRRRREASWAALREGGISLWVLKQHFIHAAAELAFRKHHLKQGEPLVGEQRRTGDEDYRAKLAELRTRLAVPAS